MWFLANSETYRQIGDRFDLSRGHCYEVVLQFINILYHVKDDYIVWPGLSKGKEVVTAFNALRGHDSFPNVIGCIDGCHIRITIAGVDKDSYINRKKFTSVVLQVFVYLFIFFMCF